MSKQLQIGSNIFNIAGILGITSLVAPISINKEILSFDMTWMLGISFLLIDMDTPGIEVKPIVTLDGEHEVNEVWFTDVKVPKKNIVGKENEGWTYAKYLLTFERTGIAGVPYSKSALNHLKVISKKSLKNGKPLIDGIHFNISHSGHQVICGFSNEGQLGVDLEKISPIDFEDFTSVFSVQEWAAIKNANNPIRAFYWFWTRKESIIKALGHNLSYLHQIELDVSANHVVVDGKRYCLQNVDMEQGFLGTVCTEEEIEELETIEELEELEEVEELEALEERLAVFLGDLEDALVEFDPGQFAVDE